MKYALLIYPTPNSHTGLPDDERAAVRAEYVSIAQEPFVLASEGLEAPETATTLRMGDGETLVTDGPFANTKEFFGGFYLIDVENLDRALDVAKRLPVIRLGGAVEVRPVLEIPR